MTPRTFLAALAVVAAVAVSAAVGLARGGETATHDHATHATSAQPTAAEAAFAAEMRRLWLEHVAWTRLAIVDFASGSPGLNATMKRLLRNQNEIGNAVKPFYGKAAGEKLTALLREHILIAVDVLEAAKSGDKAATNRALARWNANADVISAFLSKANPKHWPEAAVRSMMREHLALTTNEAVARLQGRWAADVRAADAVERAMLHMADTLSSGIVAQFPGRFGKDAS
jgi:hypothetical protein